MTSTNVRKDGIDDDTKAAAFYVGLTIAWLAVQAWEVRRMVKEIRAYEAYTLPGEISKKSS